MAQIVQRNPSGDKDLESGDVQKVSHTAHVVPAEARCRVGNPGPIGLFAFGMTALMLSFVLTTWSEATFAHMVMGYAAFFGGLTQWLAGIFELIVGNTFGAVVFFGYGSFWVGWWLLQIFTATGDLAGPAFPTGLALYYGEWAIFSLLLLILVLRKNWALRTLFTLLTLTFACLAGSPWNVNAGKAGGYFAFLTGLAACYAGFATLFLAEYGIKLPLL